ncbi:MAG: DNA polymerase III delta [Candidatus Desulfovibrio kirbyi]|uniref:DNA polymerase III delta n=1 Tax=Candidatus Desulfovibrio kirbyi TaxID=2696086 RepID=A0A6L2R5L2_9BACT|nr:MAG: DNA polymerase III delta [Candidatus Desulfovibrio kirbyi]
MPADKPGFNFLLCPDSLLLRTRLRHMASTTAGGNAWEEYVYWGDEEPQAAFWDNLTLCGMVATDRVLIVRQAHQWPATVWKKISQALARPSAQCRPFFCLEMKWEKGKPKLPAHISKLRCFAYADSHSWIWRHPGLTEHSVGKYVRDRAGELELEFAADALKQFCVSVLPDASAVETELQKFALLCGAGRKKVTTDMVSASALSLECNIFACIRHMEEGNALALWKEMARSTDSDNLFFRLLVFLEREMRLFWNILAGEDVRLYPAESAFKRALARRIGFCGVAEGMVRVMEAEWQVKNGARTTEQSLAFLVVQLTDLFRNT